MDKVAGILEVGLAQDNLHIVVNRLGSSPDLSKLGDIVLTPRHARYLANLLLDSAEHIETIDKRRGTKCCSNTFEVK
jgi:hypothetical protein